MSEPKIGKDVILGKGVHLGDNVVIWNYVVIGDNTKVGKDTRIGSFCDIGKNVVIGKRCVIQAHVTISNECCLGDNVFIGPNSSILNDKFPNSGFLTPSKIEADVIVGGCVTILPNVTIHQGAVIAAGSVVTKNVESNTVVKGIPAKPMMTRSEYEMKSRIFLK